MATQISKHTFYLKALNELSGELSALVQPRKILETFLLMSMGPVGLRCGFAVVFDSGTFKGTLVCRGIETGVARRLESGWPEVYTHCAALFEGGSPDTAARLIQANDPRVEGNAWPEDITGIVVWKIDDRFAALFGIGTTLDRRPLETDEVELLLNSTVVLSGALARALNTQQIQTLNADLYRKKSELIRARDEADNARSNLQQTTEALKTAYRNIDLLEQAKYGLKALWEGQVEQAGRVSRFDFLIIGLVSVVVGILFNHFSPNGIDLLPERFFHPAAPVIALPAAQALITNREAVIIDARPEVFFNQKRISGALNIPPAMFDIVYMIKLSDVDPDKPIVVYGRSFSRHYDEIVARRLVQRDHQNVSVLAGEVSDWESEGYAVEP
jgi:rhodanese-related sulfurtransferase